MVLNVVLKSTREKQATKLAREKPLHKPRPFGPVILIVSRFRHLVAHVLLMVFSECSSYVLEIPKYTGQVFKLCFASYCIHQTRLRRYIGVIIHQVCRNITTVPKIMYTISSTLLDVSYNGFWNQPSLRVGSLKSFKKSSTTIAT